MRGCFEALETRLSAIPYLGGETFTLADMFLYPLMWFMRLKPESAAMLQASPRLLDWYERVGTRDSVRETEPPMPTGAAAFVQDLAPRRSVADARGFHLRALCRYTLRQ